MIRRRKEKGSVAFVRPMNVLYSTRGLSVWRLNVLFLKPSKRKQYSHVNGWGWTHLLNWTSDSNVCWTFAYLCLISLTQWELTNTGSTVQLFISILQLLFYLYNSSISSIIEPLKLFFLSAAACRHKGKSSLKLRPLALSLFLSLAFSVLNGCQCEQAAVGQRGNCDCKALVLEEAGGCTVCQADVRKDGWGSVWVDYWRFPSPPSLASCTTSPLLPLTLVCQSDGRKVSPWQIMEFHSLSCMKKLKCLSQLLGMKGFGEH